jgi:hypothetical protein
MAKLYWRVKRDGKWTWIAADDSNTDLSIPYAVMWKEEEE